MKLALVMLVITGLIISIIGCQTKAADTDSKVYTIDADMARIRTIRDYSIDGDVKIIHDDEFFVTCWLYVLYNKAGISCIPDSQLER